MFITFVMEEHTVKAREHYGTKSLDLTIPTQVVKEFGIASGDVFKVVVINDGDTIKLEYIRIYAQEQRNSLRVPVKIRTV